MSESPNFGLALQRMTLKMMGSAAEDSCLEGNSTGCCCIESADMSGACHGLGHLPLCQ